MVSNRHELCTGDLCSTEYFVDYTEFSLESKYAREIVNEQHSNEIDIVEYG
jgi:hypothetical protein